jgi:hypothetical protein
LHPSAYYQPAKLLYLPSFCTYHHLPSFCISCCLSFAAHASQLESLDDRDYSRAMHEGSDTPFSIFGGTTDLAKELATRL